MHTRTVFLAAAGLLACHSTPNTAFCPAPAQGKVPLATQVLLRRGTDQPATGADFTLSLAVSGDALYVGSPRVPISGSFIGRFQPERFVTLVTRLLESGLVLSPDNAVSPPPAPACGTLALISIAIQTADGRYGEREFCARSSDEHRLATLVYQAAEGIRWQPGARTVSFAPSP